MPDMERGLELAVFVLVFIVLLVVILRVLGIAV